MISDPLKLRGFLVFPASPRNSINPGTLYQTSFQLVAAKAWFQALHLACSGMKESKQINMKGEKPDKLGFEAPQLKHYLIVLGVVALLILFSWISWFKFGWFH